MKYVIAYDIAEPKRLRRVARLLERHAIRVQKSVFIYQGNDVLLKELLDKLAMMIDCRQDIIQAWRTAPTRQAAGDARGTPNTEAVVAAVLHAHPPLFVRGHRP